MTQPESRLSRQFMIELRARGVFVFKVHGSEHMMAGLPDLVACAEGVFVGFEVKLPGKENNTSPRQDYVHEKISDAGGHVYVVSSMGQVLDGLQEAVRHVRQRA